MRVYVGVFKSQSLIIHEYIDPFQFVATPEVKSSAPSPVPKVQSSRKPSPNKSAPNVYIVASAIDGKYREVASLHVPIRQARGWSKELG